jgi:zinc-ribbon domain
MARFCTKCGSSVTEGMTFCTNCGSALAEAQAPAAPPAQAPAPAAPAVQAVPVARVPIGAAPATGGAGAVAAPGKGSPVLKIVLIVLGVIVLLSILGIGSCGYMLWRAKKKATSMMDQARTTMAHTATPEVQQTQPQRQGGAGTEAESAATKDVPPYPGSQATEAGGDLSMGGMGGMSGQEFVTDDSVDKVVEFYKEKLGDKIKVQESEGNAMFQVTAPNGLTTVTITRDENAGKTKVNIARIGK